MSTSLLMMAGVKFRVSLCRDGRWEGDVCYLGECRTFSGLASIAEVYRLAAEFVERAVKATS